MIPLRDANPSRSRPWVTTLLVAINLAAFLYELSLGKGLDQFLRQFGAVPVDISLQYGDGRFLAVWPLVTSMFLHGGWLHLVGNMLFLWIFGDNVEDRFGHLRYLLFYLAGGVVASVTHVVTNSGSTVPTIGASGAVAAVLGAYSFLFPGARVLTLVPIGILLQTMELPARIFLGIWFVLQCLSGTIAAMMRGPLNAGGVAWWAHIGGFAFGYLLAVSFFRRRRTRPRMA